MKQTKIVIAALASFALAGCASDAAVHKPGTPLMRHVPMVTADGSDAELDIDAQSSIEIDPAIQRLCDIPVAHFAFDSDALSAEAKGALDALAACFVTGPAKDKAMRIAGHADPRGEEMYNFALGQRRAGRVAIHLVKRGVADGRIETSSRGEIDATGTDEASWARDRKVAIALDDG